MNTTLPTTTNIARCPALSTLMAPMLITANSTCDTLVNYTTLENRVGTKVRVICMYTCIWLTGTAIEGVTTCGSDLKWSPPQPLCQMQPTIPVVTTVRPLTHASLYGIMAAAIIAGTVIFTCITILLCCMRKRLLQRQTDSQSRGLFPDKASRGSSTEYLAENNTHMFDCYDSAGGYFSNNIGIITKFPSNKAFNIPYNDAYQPASLVGTDGVVSLPLEGMLMRNDDKSLSWRDLSADSCIKLPRPDVSEKFRDLWTGSMSSCLNYI